MNDDGLSISLCQTGSHLHFQPFYIQAATPITAKNAGAKQPTHQALLAQPPALVTETGLLVATVFPVAVLLPTLVLCTNISVVQIKVTPSKRLSQPRSRHKICQVERISIRRIRYV